MLPEDISRDTIGTYVCGAPVGIPASLAQFRLMNIYSVHRAL